MTTIISVLTGDKQHRLVTRVVGFRFRNVEILVLRPASSGNLEKMLKLLQTTIFPDCEMEVNPNYFLKLLREVTVMLHENTSSPLPSGLGNSYSCFSHDFTNATPSRKPFLIATRIQQASTNPPCTNTHHELKLCSFC